MPQPSESFASLRDKGPEVLAALAQGPLYITEGGATKAVLQDLKAFEATQERLALLQMLATGQADLAAGRTQPANEVLAMLRERHERR